MKDPNRVLQEKEADLARVRKEIESLNIVAPLLAYEDRTPPDDRRQTSEESKKKRSTSASDRNPPQLDSEATGTDSQLSSVSTAGSSFLNALRRVR
jgi:hypothetical protein